MTEVILFHHAQGLTAGVQAFADELRAAGHSVTVPDLYEGATFATVDEGVAHARSIGFGELADRGVKAAESLPERIVYAGFSLGAMPAQQLAQTREGALGALLYHAAFPASEFGESWPNEVALQVHMMENDPWSEEDRPAAEELVANAADAELFIYPGSAHLFTDSSLAEYDAEAAKLVLQRTINFLGRCS